MKKHRVLMDLSIAMNNGYCGIANENRLVFKMLSAAESVHANGLLMSANVSTVFSNYQLSTSQNECIAQANRFFHQALHHEDLLKAKLLTKLKFAKHFFLQKKKKFDLFTIDPVFRDTIWRTVFNKSLGAQEKANILASDFSYSDLTAVHTASGSYFKRKLALNTDAHDFAIFLEPTPVSVSAGTIKMVRYHDAIPIIDPDFSGTIFSKKSLNALEICAADAYFICNSEPTRNILLQLKPELESKAFTIPAAISSNYTAVKNEAILKKIILTRLSSQIAKPEMLTRVREQVEQINQLDYIFNLAAFDPKKNVASLIRAWEKLNYQQHSQIKLIIAANSGWFSKEVEEMMLPHIEQGNIIHLNNLGADELPYLFSHAQAFVFPSYTEGFGLPPLEAMQCECPVIASDIPAHRWVLDDAALYCNPYDADSITSTLTQLLFASDSKNQQKTLIQKGLARVKQYSPAALAGEWQTLFDKIKNQHSITLGDK